jgi:hypothetical protein
MEKKNKKISEGAENFIRLKYPFFNHINFDYKNNCFIEKALPYDFKLDLLCKTIDVKCRNVGDKNSTTWTFNLDSPFKDFKKEYLKADFYFLVKYENGKYELEEVYDKEQLLNNKNKVLHQSDYNKNQFFVYHKGHKFEKKARHKYGYIR